MTRKKVKLAYIPDDSARKATFKKRKRGILKKVNELSILCGIEACAIISNPFESEEAEVWPDPERAKEVIEKYSNSSVIDESKNMNQESFMLQRIAKAKELLKKKRKENREKEMLLSMYKYMKSDQELPDNMTVADLKQLDNLIDQSMKDIEIKMVLEDDDE
ncbi:agamous-like MADS-box protein AGL80 [Arachis stenosperma]|uniref:agamous-like MADS-box protein AGL80 n=1 Tax=Arachis stenosperma TaxID=217475 RepID=UPI0025AB8D89|nr:agamous-like MADS-box protein AGL80 [Arachis stenosperma]